MALLCAPLTPQAISLFIEDPHLQSVTAGVAAVGILLCFYAAPLSTMAEVRPRRACDSHILVILEPWRAARKEAPVQPPPADVTLTMCLGSSTRL
jgi:hypothetical protein